MSEERVPKEFFSAELVGKAATLLLRMNAPGEVWFTHLDAPGWAIVGTKDGAIIVPADFQRGNDEGAKLEIPEKGWWAKPIISEPPPTFRDDELSLSGMDFGDGIFWDWRGAPRTELVGRCGQGVEWDEIRRFVSSIAPALTKLLTPADSHSPGRRWPV